MFHPPDKLYTADLETNYVIFTFSAPCKNSVCESSLKFLFGETNTISTKIKHRSEKIIEHDVHDTKMYIYINKLLALYHKFKRDGSILFVTFENNELEIVVTNS